MSAFNKAIPIVYINRDEDVYRRLHMERQFKEVGIKDYIRFSAFTDAPETTFLNYTGIDLSSRVVSQVSKCMLSHLLAIKSLDFKNSDYALIFEDDAVLTTSKNWSFTLDEFIERLPEDWDIVQLYINFESYNESLPLLAYSYMPSHYSTVAYAISKKHAERIVEAYFTEGIPDFKKVKEMPMHIGPYLADRVLYTPQSISVSLFSTEKFVSTILDDVPQGYHDKSQSVIDLWANNPASLDTLLSGLSL